MGTAHIRNATSHPTRNSSLSSAQLMIDLFNPHSPEVRQLTVLATIAFLHAVAKPPRELPEFSVAQ
jgi:hypothetical protein